MTYTQSLLIDILTLGLCGLGLFQYANLSHSHPAVVYLFFHVYTFTWRLLSLSGGARTLFSDWGPAYWPVTEEEIVRAALLADVALVAFTVACLLVARRSGRADDIKHESVPTLNTRIVWTVVAIAMPIGMVGQFLYSAVPTTLTPGITGTPGASADLGTWRESSYLFMLQSWPGLLLLILIYCYGFRRWLTIPLVVYLAIMAIQGYHRFRVIVPAILLIQIYLDRRQRKWPGLGGIVLVLAIAAAFFPLKVVGRMVQQQESISNIADVSVQMISDAGKGQADDQQFLDQFASSLTLVDNTGSFYLGKPFLAVVTLPVPRQWWPEKPGLADLLTDISRPSRPMAEVGMILTYIGEAYANFGYFGIVLVPFGVGWVFARLRAAAYARSYASIFRFTYLMMACNLIQVFRDGLVSLVIFTAVHMMPLTVIVLLHKWFAEFRSDDDLLLAAAQPASTLAGREEPTSTSPGGP